MVTFIGNTDDDEHNGASKACKATADVTRARAALLACVAVASGLLAFSREANAQTNDLPGEIGGNEQTENAVGGATVRGPVAAVGHGALLDAEGNELDLSPPLILEMQGEYIEALHKQADPAQQFAFDDKKQHLAKQPAGRILDSVYANA